MSGAEKRIDAFVDATRGLRALRQAVIDEGETPSRLAAITQAKADLKHAEAMLNGSQLGAARRQLNHVEVQR